MSEPIRLLHFADVHIGMENYGKIDPTTGISSRVMDFLRRFGEIIEFAEENEADLVIFAGDAFKSSTPNPTFQREFARRIKRLAAVCPVVLLVGNHDIPSMSQKASSVEIFHTLDVENVVVGRADRLLTVETRRGPVQVATVPYPVKQRLLADMSLSGMSIEDLDRAIREKVDLLIRNLAEQVDPAFPAVLTGHFTVQGAKLGSERGVMLGRDVAVLVSTLADPAWDYVALGQIDFGEEGDAKGFCWVSLARGETTYEFVELPARPFVTVRVDVRGLTDPTQAVIDEVSRYDLADAVVRVIVTASPENEPLLRDRDIKNALRDVAFLAAIQRDIDYPVRTRLGVERPEGLAPIELFDLYLSKREIDPQRADLLTGYAEAIFEADAAERDERG
jgi:exonuclease SbcD